MAELANPFDEFGEPEDVPASEGLQAGPGPSLAESFTANFSGLAGFLSSKPRQLMDVKTVQRSETEGVAQPGDSPFAGKVSQAEADAARQRVAKAKREKEAYEAFHSDTISGKAAGLVGGVLGGLADPVGLVGTGGVLARGGTAVAGAFGASGVVARILGTGVEAGAVNAAMDVAGQGFDIASSMEEKFSSAQAGAAFAIGAGFGVGMHSLAEGAGALIRARQAAREVQAGQTPEPAAQAVSEPPEAVAAQDATARAVETIPDEQLTKIAEAVATVEHTGEPTERVAIPVSVEEAVVLKNAGVDVDDALTVPAAAVDTVVREQARREIEAVEPAAPPKREKRQPIPMTLSQFIARNGGLERTGDTVNFQTFVPGAGNLVRKGGKSIDNFWRDHLADHGYIQRDPDGMVSRDIRDELFELLRRERMGEEIYSERDAQRVRSMEADRIEEDNVRIHGEIESHANDIAAAHEEVGLQRRELDERYLYDAAELIYRGDESDPLAAYERAVMERELADPVSTIRQDFDVPFEVDDAVSGGTAQGLRREVGGEGGGRERRGGQGGSAREGQGVSGIGARGGRASGEDPAQALSAMAAQPQIGGPAPAATTATAERRFSARRELGGEATKPAIPPTPEEARAHNLTKGMRDIAERLSRKLEVDRRFTLKKALGEYAQKTGVIRIRQEGDMEVFAHEVGHAIDQRLKNADLTKAQWDKLRTQHEDELKRLDANTLDPTKQTVNEGVAEFLRTYVTNPAYARKQAPNVAEAFDRLTIALDPELGSILADAAKLSQIDSGLEPTDVMRSMISPGVKPAGVAKFNQERKEQGLTPTLGLWFGRFYAGLFGKDYWFKRFTNELREAHFDKTGKPLPEFGWSDPYKSYRMLPGAAQSAVGSLYDGVRGYGRSMSAPESASLHGALSKAFNGHITLVRNPDDPLVKSFSGYLIARRSRALYERWKNGDLRNPPVRASENEVLSSIAAFEEQFPQFVEAADDVFDFANAMWRKKFEAGLISREVYDTVAGRNDDYVPFFRDMEDNKGGGKGGGGRSAGQERSVVKTIQGSSRNIIDPIHSLVFDAAQTERIIALNDTIKLTHRLAQTGGEFAGRFLEKIPNSELRATSIDLAEGMRNAARSAGVSKADAEIIIRHMEEMVGDDLSATVFRATETTARGERVMFYWDGGERVALKVGDDEASKQFYDLFSGMSAPEKDILFAFFGKANALFSQLITNPPQFAIKNLLMDNISRVFIGKNVGALGRIPGSAIAAGFYTQIFDREFAKAYAAIGGIRGGVASAAARELTQAKGLKAITLKPRNLEQLTAEVRALAGNPKDLAFAVAKSPWHALELIVKGVEATETIGRLGQAKLVQRHLLKQGVKKGDAFQAAVYEARDILDYDRKGWGVSAATRFFPFLNAGFQGLDRSQRVLFGDPLQAALQAHRRGGYDKLDADAKSALHDAVINWGMIAAGAVLSMGYYAWMADNPVYQRMSDYMRRRYYIFPAGQNKDGQTNVVTMPKPFDHAGGIFGAIEAGMDGVRRGDPQGWHRVVDALKDGFVPRQLGGIESALSSLPPAMKIPFEVFTGQKLGFDGGPSYPIVPDSVKALPPEMQVTATTSWLSKKVGQWFGQSPVVVEHVLNGMGGTAVKDANTLVTAVLDDQPNVTVKDAMRQIFFGALYREQRGGGAFRSDLMEIMGRENGQYVTAANGYAKALEAGDISDAGAIYGRGNDLAKTVMTIRSGSYKPEQRQLHPLERTAALGDIFSKVTKDLAASHLELLDRTKKRGQTREFIDVPRATARALQNAVGSLMAEEIRNGLTIAGQPGYQNYDVIDTKLRYEAIRALSPEVADEIKKRMDKAHILPVESVKRAWPVLKERLLKDREQAQIGDLRHLQ